MNFSAIGDTMLNIWGKVWPVVVALLLFALIITVHEFGHFIFAKLFKVKVNEFSIGFGPKIFSKKKGETLYSVRAIPAGGFCAMEGEDEDSSEDGAFCNKKVWKRIIIVVAGAAFNILLGFILVATLLGIKGQYGTPVIHSFRENAVSNKDGGLMVGDKIIEVDGRNVYCYDDVIYFVTNSEDTTLDMTVIRNNQEVTLKNVSFESEIYEGQSFVNLDMIFKGEKCSIKKPFSFLKEAVLETVSMGRLVWMTLGDMITGRYGINDIMGPVGTVGAVSDAVSTSMKSLLFMLALISVNLGIINLLPIPALDGGKVVLLAYEGVTRKKVSAKVESAVTIIGLSLLLLLMLVITGNDILRWFRN